MGVDKAVNLANKCLDNRDTVPGAPAWHMGKVRLAQSRSSFELLQNTIDYLACKAQSGRPFSGDEKEFMKELFEALWWGGQASGLPEAAQLANHYVNGGGARVRIRPDVYRTSVIVEDTASALKKYIQTQHDRKRGLGPLKSDDIGFMQTADARALQRGRMDSTQGRLLPNGCLLAEQSNLRLKNTDNRFYLSVTTVRANQRFISNWGVDSLYDFEPFSARHITNIPLSAGYVLKIPDGLSHHLTRIGVATNFSYHAEWTEHW